MLTRLEVDGFKNLLEFAIDFGPFTCIAGENGAGKSNVFDAIDFLSLLADHSLMEAAQMVRSIGDGRMGDPRDLFWNGLRRDDLRMSLAVEMVVPKEVHDDFGRPATASITFLRYELTIGYEHPQGLERIGRLVLLREELRHINLGDAAKHLRFPHSAKDFRGAVVSGRRTGVAFVSTEERPNGAVITIHQDGGSRGQPRPASATKAPATVLSTVTGAHDPTILAARREMQSWRRLSLEPSALRTSDRYTDPRAMTASGRHLPAALYRIAVEASKHEAGEHQLLESRPDPKQDLREALLKAGMPSGRRRAETFKRRFGEHRRQLLSRLDIDGRVRELDAWSRLETAISRQLTQ